MNKRKIKKKLHLNNKGIDGKIANNTTFDFDFNVEKKESNKLRQLVGILSKYVNKFDKRDKMYLVGYNNAGFDNSFLRALFQQCGDKYFGSWFYPNCMDVYVMVTPFLMGVRNDMENFKLMTVAKTMGIEIDENKLHDATYDIELTRDIFYRIISKMDVRL